MESELGENTLGDRFSNPEAHRAASIMFYSESKGSKGGRIPTDVAVAATEKKSEKPTTVGPKARPGRLGTTRGRERPPEFLERPCARGGGALMHFRLRRPAVRVSVVAPRPEHLELSR